MKILFVCLGNICRSPLAEAIMADKIKKLKLDAEVDSAGFETFHRGDPADPRSVEVAARHGIRLSDHVARMFSTADFDRFDKIYVMDRHNYGDVIGKARNEQDKKKVDYLLNVLHPGHNRHVPDPWYGGKEDFETVFDMLDEACEAIGRDLISANPKVK